MVYGNRRNFILGSTAASLGAMLPYPQTPFHSRINCTELANIQDSRLRDLIENAIESAMAAGASYADARLSHSEGFFAAGASPNITEHMGFGVRAIVNGFWGFAASPVWNITEAVRLGRAAVNQAKAHGPSKTREMILAPMEKNESGNWTMPVKDDPFEMAYEEIVDFLNPLRNYAYRKKNVVAVASFAQFKRFQKAYGSSLGQYTTQKLYKSNGGITLNLVNDMNSRHSGVVETLSHAGMGFELFRDQPIREIIDQVHEEALQSLELPESPVDVGRYETLINNMAIANLVSRTIGKPTEIDTAFGYEANAGGTGFIDPVDMLGTFRIGSPLLNISGDRARPGSVGLVKWDDEGVEPKKFDIVKDGIVVGMQCNREGAGWIKDYLDKSGLGVSSIGCAYAPDAMDVPMVHNVDLTVAPSEKDNSLESLRSQIKKGIELQSPMIDIDFQGITGFTMGNAFEIRNGKRISRYPNASMLFRTPELWNNIVDIGGANSSARFGIESFKGEPLQVCASSVYSVPAVFKEMTFVGTR